MGKLEHLDRLIMKYVIITAVIILFIFNYQSIFFGLNTVWKIIAPVVYGFIFAYILNLIMVKYEQWWFPNSTNDWAHRTRRPMSIILALITMLVVIILVLWLIIPQLISLIQTVIESIPLIIEFGQNLFLDLERVFPEIDAVYDNFNLNWENVVREFGSFANNIVGSTFTTVQIVTSSLYSLVIIVVVAIYSLLSKERFINQLDRLGQAYLKKDNYRRIAYVLNVTDESFSSFMTGMLLEAIIYGSLVTLGMWLFGFPYAGMIGALSGALALIPMVGAILSAIIGTLLIFVQNPAQGILFLIFNIVLQQLESNVIYPRVVGASIGLPGLWTFIAVTIGGGIMGPAGFFLGVPIASAIYKLIQTNVEYREAVSLNKSNVEFRQL